MVELLSVERRGVKLNVIVSDSHDETNLDGRLAVTGLTPFGSVLHALDARESAARLTSEKSSLTPRPSAEMPGVPLLPDPLT